MTTMRFGLEIECLHANNELEVGPYHGGKVCGRFWNAQSDSSIHQRDSHARCQVPTEFVLNKPISADEIPEALDELKEIVKDTTDVFKNIEINDSCGAHIHFSVLRRKLHRQVPFSYYGRIRNLTYHQVQKQLPGVFGSFRKQYFRRYAKKLSISGVLTDRAVEFNSTSETGIEWRSFNLMGVTKWSEMKKMYKIATDAITEVLTDGLKEEHFFKQSGSFGVGSEQDLLGISKMIVKNLEDPELKKLGKPYEAGGLCGRVEIPQEDFGELFPSEVELDTSEPDPPPIFDADDGGIYLLVKIGGEEVKIKAR